MSAQDAAWMQHALRLAARAEGRTAPNPMVGAVLVDPVRQVVLSEGVHQGAGHPHAEAEALRPLGGQAPGATLYVTLEPCCHHGRTPPCTDALRQSGVSRVVVAMRDPDPRMQGRGLQILRDAGLEVVLGVEEAAARRLNMAWLTARAHGRPLVVLKAAASLDGHIADAHGQSQWITGPAARQAGHTLRDRLDAILIGSGTLLADDPSLTTRLEGGQTGRNALPVLLDSRLRCPTDARVLRAGRRPLIFCAPDAPARPALEALAEVVRVPRSGAGLDWAAVLGALVQRDVHSVLVEGGGRIHRSLLGQGWVDRVELFLAPLVLAGGLGWVQGEPFALASAPRLRLTRLQQVGEDAWLTLEPPGMV